VPALRQVDGFVEEAGDGLLDRQPGIHVHHLCPPAHDAVELAADALDDRRRQHPLNARRQRALLDLVRESLLDPDGEDDGACGEHQPAA
jgi:hypothetical protein